ncbi:hypothetical protein GPECTOR_34g705 [Gonium pectorale]|uniref:Uncharacterized protein n=1 Tax=Gonium pectorale TaxID=33097 RepID=A0A150GCH2_GONPE|nr:hypothetical protein GPECTOR_34g705 [Gonium pectorale]|eukprot:KXZ47546.1 hypothetical protein GPECTOR_34g705 [Gonium pectorale]
MSRVGVHSLVLVANNTGILAPVVLEAAVGPSAAAVGMLATIALYFQQLPVAMVLFELDRLVMGNTLMWTTGAATVVSMMGLQALLDPAVPSHLPALGFVEGTLSWLARCSVPVSLFAMGLWTASATGGAGRWDGSLRSTAVYLCVKLLLLPWLMVFVNSVLGLSGRLARSLVVLTCVPVGQNAFIVTEQYGEGAREVMAVMQAGLLLMLPHVAMTMAALRWAGMYEEAGGFA